MGNLAGFVPDKPRHAHISVGSPELFLTIPGMHTPMWPPELLPAILGVPRIPAGRRFCSRQIPACPHPCDRRNCSWQFSAYPASLWAAGIVSDKPGMPTSLWAKKNPPSGGFFNDSKAHPCSDKRLQTDKKRSPVSGDRSGRALPLTQENQKLPTRSTTTAKTNTTLQQHKRINTIDTTQSHNAINNIQSIRHNRYCSIDTAD